MGLPCTHSTGARRPVIGAESLTSKLTPGSPLTIFAPNVSRNDSYRQARGGVGSGLIVRFQAHVATPGNCKNSQKIFGRLRGKNRP